MKNVEAIMTYENPPPPAEHQEVTVNTRHSGQNRSSNTTDNNDTEEDDYKNGTGQRVLFESKNYLVRLNALFTCFFFLVSLPFFQLLQHFL